MPLPVLADFLLLSAIWGSSFLFIRMGVMELGALPTAAARVAIAAAFLLPLMAWRGHAAQFRLHWKKVLLVGVVNSGLPFALFSFALLTITTGLSAILNATVPLFGALVTWVWLNDRPSGSRIAGLALGFLGVAMLAWDKAGLQPGENGVSPAWAVLACLLATLSYGVAATATKRYLTGIPPLVTATGSQVGATLFLAVPAALSWPQGPVSTPAWMGVLVLGVLCTGVAYILYFRLIEKAGPSRALAVTFVVPVFALVYGTLLLGEQVTGWMLLCGAVVLCGTALSTGVIRLPALFARKQRQ